MKSAKLLNILMAGTLLATLATGCNKTPKNLTHLPGMQARPGGTEVPGGAILPGGTQGNPLNNPTDIAPAFENANQDRAALAAQTIYFEFDRSAIKASEQSKLDAVATYLKSTQGVQLLIEGHCDERGTEEYNRALGERRAIAAREYLLQKHGISSERVTTASFGKDRPASLEKTEEGYAKNRRDEFVILRPR
jgi:peptidoglycan-associated lipoprotein